MGVCTSLCNTEKLEEDNDTKTNINTQFPINELSILKQSNLKENSAGKSRKNKSRIKKAVKFKLDEEEKDENLIEKKESIPVIHFYDTYDNQIVEYEDEKLNENKNLKQ